MPVRANFPILRALWIALLACGVWLGLVCPTEAAFAQSTGGFISPGELAADHQELSGITGCLSCHSVGSGVSADKCMACHDAVRKQVATHSGFHAEKGKDCASCHPDHRGVDFPLVRMDSEKFDHDPTGFPLEGAHAKAECKDCHKKPGVWSGLQDTCSSCHDTPHGVDELRPNLGDCARCHGVSKWDAIPLALSVFDHQDAKQADYALHGQHAKVDCEKCHAKFKFTPIKFESCTDCHKDEHGGQFGSRTCDDCHTVERADFALRDFDHSKTDYKLVGPHKRVACEGCHGNGTKARYVDLPHDRCETCHADPHRGQFKPRDCDVCHSPLADKFSRGAVDHDATKFPLRLAHADVACSECHGEGRKAVFAGLKFDDCIACHEDAHEARFGEVACSSCHTDGKWEVENFDHARTSFLLTGKHEQVACADCHGAGDKRVLFPLKYGECADCHASDDPHKSESTAICTDCHSTVDWTAVTFAHGDATEFPLVGEHAKVPCGDCHKDRAMVKLDMTCAACHEEDRPDPHFDGECGSCHLADGWIPATLGVEQHAGTGFALHGSHLNVTCAACHEGATTASPFCADCHADDEPHRNQLGSACADCHTTTDWFFVRFNHATTGWPLRGVHQIAACADCHAAGYVGTPTECRRCHESDHPNDSLHSDPLAGDCELCHRPYAWEPARSPHGSD